MMSQQPMMYAAAPQPQQMVYAQPEQQQVMYVDENGNQVADPNQQVMYVDENGNQVADPNQQVVYVDENGNQVADPNQQVMYVDEAGNPVNVDAAGQVVYAEPAQLYAPPAAARVNISPEIFAKLAAGMPLTPEEQAQLSGEAVAPVAAASIAASIAPGMPMPASIEP